MLEVKGVEHFHMPDHRCQNVSFALLWGAVTLSLFLAVLGLIELIG